MPSYFWFRRVATPKEQQLVSWVGPGSAEQGGTVTRAGGCVAALLLIAVGMQKYCLGPSAFLPRQAQKGVRTAQWAEERRVIPAESALARSSRWMRGKGVGMWTGCPPFCRAVALLEHG